MFRQYLKLAARIIRSQKGYSFINFLGLSIGLAVSVVVLLFVQFEWSFDNFHTKRDRVFRLKHFELFDDGLMESFTTPYILMETVQSEVPQVQAATRVSQSERQAKLPNNIEERQPITFVSPDFFEIFDFELLPNASKTVLDGKYDIMVTETVAEKFFGKDNPIGREIELQLADKFIPFTVTAILKDIPNNSSIRLEALVSDQLYVDIVSERARASWYNIFTETYVLTSSANDKAALETGMDKMIKNALGENYVEGAYYVRAYALDDIHFHTGKNPGSIRVTNPQMIYILFALGLLVLLLASINFTTMAIGKSIVRAKEVGVRKTAGALRLQLTMQFLTEAMLMILLAFGGALVFAKLLLPEFNTLFQTTLDITFSPVQVLVMLGLVVFLALGAASFPAVFLSGLPTVKVIKGNFSHSFGKQSLRKVLVGFQFFISFLVVSCTLVMYHQMDTLKNHDLGFRPENVFAIPVQAPRSAGLDRDLKTAFAKANLLRERLLARSEVSNAAISVNLFGDNDWWKAGFEDEQGKAVIFNLNFVSGDYLETMGIDIVAGRNFYEDPTLDSSAFIVNERFAEMMAWTNVEEARLPASGKFEGHQIIGIAKNFNHASLYNDVTPVMIAKNPILVLQGLNDINISGTTPKVLVRAKIEDTAAFGKMLEEEYQNVYPGEAFQFFPFDTFLFESYQDEERLVKMVTYTAGLTLFISFLGLLALISMTIAGRTKEIGIRKVLGASTASIFLAFNREFVLITLLGILAAIPIGLLLMQGWVQQFVVQNWPDTKLWMLAVGAAVLLTILLVSLQSLNAARINPAKTLKSE
mgnify:CR=1 FL=1